MSPLVTSTSTTPGTSDWPPRQHHVEESSETFVIDGDQEIVLAWKVITTELTDAEAAAIEKKLDSEPPEGSITFGSAEEAIDFLRSRRARKDE